MIIHTVQFKLKAELNAEEKKDFFEKAHSLTTIPGVNHFKVYDQVSDKNSFSYCFSMEFVDQATYDFYSNHPLHSEFVEKYWLTKVASFQEADFQASEKDPDC